MHDQLRGMVRLRLEQGRIHIGMRLGARGQSLKRLGPSDLAAIDGHGRGVRHVLRFERTHLDAAVRSEESRVGKECVSTCRSRWSTYYYKKKTQTQTQTKVYTNE